MKIWVNCMINFTIDTIGLSFNDSLKRYAKESVLICFEKRVETKIKYWVDKIRWCIII